jgi:hypothetical protein
MALPVSGTSRVIGRPTATLPSLEEQAMSTPDQPVAQPAKARGPGRRIAAAVMVCTVIFLTLWLTLFSLMTSLVVASACCVVVVAASVAWDPFEMVLDIIAAIVFGVLAVIAAIFGAIFSLFGW